VIVDEHVAALDTDDTPDLVVVQVYITNARRAYRIADAYRAKGVFVALGGLHVTSPPDEAAPHANAVFLGPGEQIFPQFLADFRAGRPLRLYKSTAGRTLDRLPGRHLYFLDDHLLGDRRFGEALFEGMRGMGRLFQGVATSGRIWASITQR